MSELKRRQIETISNEVAETSLEPVKRDKPLDMTKVVSTGSTLLDLAISGKRRRGGGIPAGIVVEISGPPGTGKTAILAEIAASIQSGGGKIIFDDAEARLDKEYTRIYGVNITEQGDYFRSKTVSEVFGRIREWKTPEDKISLYAGDGIASLSTDMELEKEDKMGQRRAKEFHEGLRKTCKLISNNTKLVVFTNQTREGTDMYGNKKLETPGGLAIPFYASLRIRVKNSVEIKKEVILESGVKVVKTIGIRSMTDIIKSTIDDPYREAPISIIFSYGIDTIRDNLQYIKDMKKLTKYITIDKEFQSLDKAIAYVEENNLQGQLREQVIDLWEEIESKFQVKRLPKER